MVLTFEFLTQRSPEFHQLPSRHDSYGDKTLKAIVIQLIPFNSSKIYPIDIFAFHSGYVIFLWLSIDVLKTTHLTSRSRPFNLFS